LEIFIKRIGIVTFWVNIIKSIALIWLILKPKFLFSQIRKRIILLLQSDKFFEGYLQILNSKRIIKKKN
jgi:hypothetical protein